jgi:hypothetical protein
MLPSSAAAIFWLALYPRMENVQGINQNIYGDMREWCETTQPEGVMACDVGRIGYYCPNTYIYDICGLVWEPIADKYNARTNLPKVLAETRPDYLLLNPIASYMDAMRSEGGYSLRRRFAADGLKQAEIGTDYTQAYTLEYYLFEKTP